MIAFLEAKVCEKNPDYMIVALNGMGLRLNYDPQYASRMPSVGETSRVYTYLHVREDELSLYAFPSYEEKQLFELLLTVSGFGPKIAGAVTASMPPSRFALAILNADVKTLTMIKGVGRKSAERLILELKDKMAAQETLLTDEGETEQLPPMQGTSAVQEAIAALRVLGYSQREAEKALAKVLKEKRDITDVSEMIRLALRELAIL